MKYELRRTNPDGTTDTLVTSDLQSVCIMHEMGRAGLNEKLEVISHEDDTPDFKQLADGWKVNALKQITLLDEIADIVKCNEPGRSTRWFYDLTQKLIDSGYITENETSYSHKDAIKNNII